MERKTRKRQQLKGRTPERTESGLGKHPKSAFVIMPFNPGLEPVYLKIIQPILTNAGFKCDRGDNKSESIAIIDKVIKLIEDADLIVCDLTGGNANVYYELGYARALKKQTILLSQTIPPGQLPFDVRHLHITMYEDDKFSLLQLREDLSEVVNKISPLVDRPTTRRSYPNVAKDEVEAARSSIFHFSSDARRYAVRFLGECGDKESYDRIRNIIETARYRPDDDVNLIRDALTALYKINQENAKQDLTNLGLFNSNDFVRERAVGLLSNYRPTRDMVEGMLRQLTDTSWGVRVAVCQALGQWADERKVPLANTVIEVLKGMRRSDSQFPVRVAAEDVLNKFYSVQEDLPSMSDDTAPIELEDELLSKDDR
jgi:hypothetical protein